jgi:hypothetical protein
MWGVRRGEDGEIVPVTHDERVRLPFSPQDLLQDRVLAEVRPIQAVIPIKY